MSERRPKLFLTGDPGCGKTTVLKRVVEQLSGRGVHMTGFLTEELRDRGRRVGFQGATLDGGKFLLAHVKSKGPIRVGHYGIELLGLEAVGVPSLVPAPGVELVVLDEVGKMESFSPAFHRAVEDLLAADVPVLATVAVHGVGFVKRVRQDPRVSLIRMSRDAREGMVGELLRRLERAGIGAAKTSRGRAAGTGRHAGSAV